MDTAQWPKEIVVKPLEEIVTNTRCQKQDQQGDQSGGLDGNRKGVQKEQAALNCPRCKSSNTKFCYYNNYSLTQPRYLCKTCRRYWTQGGSLRNIPVGGASRKNKRSNSISSSSSFSSSAITENNINNSKLPDLVAPQTLSTNPKIHEAQDFRTISDLVQVPNKTHISSSALELLTGITNSTSFMPTSVQDPNSVSVYTNGFNFFLDGLGMSSRLHQESIAASEASGRLLFPFENLKQAPITTASDNGTEHHHQQNREEGTGGYWTGMLGGGSW